MHAALAINILDYTTAIVTTIEVVGSIAALSSRESDCRGARRPSCGLLFQRKA
jgi:hypothetical protein